MTEAIDEVIDVARKSGVRDEAGHLGHPQTRGRVRDHFTESLDEGACYLLPAEHRASQ
jgi:hypothetical protein